MHNEEGMENKKRKISKCRDRSCKVMRGFVGAEILRNSEQQKKMDRKRARRDEETMKNIAKVAPEQGVNGTLGFIDLEEWLSNPANYTESGRHVYLDPRLIPVRAFDPFEQWPKDMNPAVMCYGKRRTGKTFTADWVFHRMGQFYDQCFVYTETKYNGFWQRRVPGEAIIEGWNPEHGNWVFELQRLVNDDPEEAWIKYKYTGSTLIILDDVISDDIFMRSDGTNGILGALYVQGRHMAKGSKGQLRGGFTIWTNTQHDTSLPPKIRENVDLAVVLRQDKMSRKDRIWQEYIGTLSRVTAHNLIDMYTRVVDPDERENENNDEAARSVFIINTAPTRSWNHKFYYCIPTEVPDYKIGSEEFWRNFSKRGA
jgi:hypothetical protein